MANKRYVVELSAEERARLSETISKGKSSAKAILKARILLKADQGAGGEGWTDARICEALDTNVTMVAGVRAKLVTEGLDAVFARKKRVRPPIEPIFDGERQAQLIALACSEPPEGHARWSMRLLAEKVVEREIVPAAHFNTVGRALKKTSSSRTAKPVGDPAQGQRRLRRRDGGRARGLPSPARSRAPAGLPRRDHQAARRRDAAAAADALGAGGAARLRVRRNGVANLFMLFAPLEGWRHVEVTERRTAIDFAHVLKHLVDVCFPAAATIVLVLDNLNTHVPAALYEAFPPAEARRLAERFEWHYTPKHGSWLNMAEFELSVLAGQCLDRRIEDRETLAREVDAWLARRNAGNATADWRFTTEDARIKLSSLYPAI